MECIKQDLLEQVAGKTSITWFKSNSIGLSELQAVQYADWKVLQVYKLLYDRKSEYFLKDGDFLQAACMACKDPEISEGSGSEATTLNGKFL